MRFQRFNARLAKSLPWSTHFIFGVLFLMLAVGLVYSIVIKGWIFAAIIALGFLVFGRRYYFLYIAPARKFDGSSFNNYEQTYVFRKQNFSAAAGETEMKRRFDEIRTVYETEDDIYLYFNKSQAFIVAKDGFPRGSAKELEKRLIGFLGPKRYIHIKK